MQAAARSSAVRSSASSSSGSGSSYQDQTAGINLSTRTRLADPAWYQWKFTGCQEGAVIELNQPVTLTNTVGNDSVVGCRRAWGINLCWANTVKTAFGKNFHKDVRPKP